MGGLSCTIFHVGKPKASFVRSGIEYYAKQIRPYASLELKTLREEPLRKGLSVQEVRKRERERLRKTMDARTTWVVLDEKGKQFDSKEFASLLEQWMVQGRSRLAFLIGGPFGLAPEIRKEATLALSLSPMTLPHEMALLVLMEQLYRALAVLNQLPYPK